MSTSNIVPITPETKVPDFITRADISQMNDEQLEAFLEGIRERRMLTLIVYEQTLMDKEEAASEKAKLAIDKELTQIMKTIEALNKNFDKLEDRINKLRGLRIQAGLHVV